MRPKTYVIVFLILAVLGATALAWKQYEELIALRAANLDGDERVAFEARLAELKKRNLALQAQLAALEYAKTSAETSADVAKARAAARESAAEERAQLAALLAQDPSAADEAKREETFELLGAMADTPEFQKLLALEQRGKVDAKYAALFKRLKLSPEDQAKLEGLLSDRQSAYADAMIAARDQGLTGKDAREIAGAIANATQKQINGSIKDLLGPQGFNQFQNYERTLPQREAVDQIAQRLSYTSTPLTPRQQDQLVQVLATTAATPKPVTNSANNANAANAQKLKPAQPIAPLPGPLANLGIGSAPSAPITNAAVNQSRTFLSPQQTAVLQQVQQQQQAQQTLNTVLNTKKTTTPAPKPGK